MTTQRRLEGELFTECAEWVWEQLQEDGVQMAGELIELIMETERELGVQGRRWLAEYWAEERMIRHYEHVYELLQEDPALVRRQPELSLDGTRHFSFRGLPDLIYRARAKRWTSA